MPTIRLPIKCSTAKKCDNAIDAAFNWASDAMDGLLNFVIKTSPIKWAILGTVGLLILAAVSAVLYFFGGIVFGSFIGMVTGHGREMISSESWYFAWGGYIGIPVGWFLLLYSTGYLKFKCIDNGPKDPATAEMDENAALVNRVRGES